MKIEVDLEEGLEDFERWFEQDKMEKLLFIYIVTTLASGLQQKQGLTRVQAKP